MGKATQGAARGRRVKLSPEKITDAAIRIADAEGLEAVSIRRIAAELNARPMSLYDHFEDKGGILDSMVDAGTADMVVRGPLPSDWRGAMEAIARRAHANFRAHPWFITLVGRRPRFGPNAQKAADQVIRALADLPLEEDERWTLMGIVNDYVLGYSLRAVATAPGRNAEAIPRKDLEPPSDLASLAKNLRARTTEERFESGLQAVLDGLERRYLRGTE